MEGHTVKNSPDDRESRLIVTFAVGCLVLALVLLVAFLADDSDGSESGTGTNRCPAAVGAVDPVTCQPYGSTGAGTNNSGSSAHRPKAPAVKVPAPPKVPAAPPRVRLTK